MPKISIDFWYGLELVKMSLEQGKIDNAIGILDDMLKAKPQATLPEEPASQSSEQEQSA
jgi:hypothetical protein